MRLSLYFTLLLAALYLPTQKTAAQTVIFSNPGTTYNNTDAVTTDTYGPVSISSCSSISFSINYNFSLPFAGAGNMESSDECPFGIPPCAGDPTDPQGGGCADCWDFFYVQFQIDGVNVNTQLIGVPGSINQSGTLTYGPVCSGAASTATIIVQTQTWAANESITFSNITMTCWDGTANLSANPNPACSGAPFTLTAALNNAPSVSTTQWSGGAGTITNPGNLSTTVTGAPVGTHTYTFTATDDNACTESATIDVTVNPGAGMDDPADQTVCSGDQVTVNFTGTGSPDYNWVNSNTSIGLGASGTGDISFTAAGLSATATATLTVTPTENGCTGPSQTFTITVNPLPTVNQPGNISVCGGLPVNVNFSGTTGSTFAWTNDNTNIGLGASGNGNISFNTLNGSNQEVATISVSAVKNGCTGPPVTFTVTVNPTPSVVDPPNQTVCGGTSVEVQFVGNGNPTFNWANSNTSIGLGSNGNGDISFTAANVTNPTTGSITVTPVASGCTGNPQNFTITVNPTPSANNISDVTACGNTATDITISGSAGATFNWTNDNTAIGLGASGSGNISFTTANVTNLEFANITVVPVFAACQGAPVDFSITVNPVPTVDNPSSQTVCSGSVVNINFTGTGNPVFNWFNTNTAIGLGATGTGNISFTATGSGNAGITVTPVANGCTGLSESLALIVVSAPTVNQPADVAACSGSNVAVNFSGTGGATFNWTNSNTAIGLGASGAGNISFTAAGGGSPVVGNLSVTPTLGSCTGAAMNFSITVNPSPTVNDPADQSVCTGSPVTVTFTGTDSPTFNWTNNNTAIGLGASGSGDINFNATGSGTGTITVTPVANGCSGASQSFDLNVAGVPVVDSIANVSACSADTISISITGTAGAIFTWDNSNTAIGLGASGSGDILFVAANDTVPITGTVTVTPSLNGCTGNPRSFDITIHPLPTLIVDSVACSPDGLIYHINLSSTGDSIVSTFGVITKTGTGFLIDSIPADSIVLLTGIDTLTGCESLLIVNAPNCSCPQVNTPTNPNNPVICDGDQVPALTCSVGQGNTADWYTAPTGGTLLLMGDTSFLPTMTFPPGVYNFYAEARDTGMDCTSPTRLLVTLTVNALPAVTQMPDTIFCAGAPVALNFSGSAGASFNWTNDNPAIGLPASGSGNLNFTATNTNNAAINANLVVTPVLNGCSGPAMSFLLTVDPPPTMSQPSDQSLCAGSIVNVNFTGSTGALFNWTNSDPSIGLSGSGTGNISFTAAAVGAVTTGTVSVIPTLPGCASGTPVNFSITVKPAPTVNAPANQTVCPGNPVTVAFTGTAGSVFSWTNSNTAIGLGAAGSGDISFTADNSTANTILANLSVTPDLNGCAGTVQNFTISVVPQLTLTVNNTTCAPNLMTYSMSVTSNANTLSCTAGTVSGSSPNFTVSGIPNGTNVIVTGTNTAAGCTTQQAVAAPNCNCPPINPPNGPNFPVICEGTATPALMVNVPAGITVDWYATPTGGVPLLSGSASFTPPGMFSPGTYIFYAEARDVATGCTSATRTPVFLTVTAAPTMTQPIDQAVCAGFTISVGFNGTSGATFNWTNSNPAIGLAASGTGNINFTAINNGTTPVVATISVTPTLFGCNGQPKTFTITVNPAPSMTDPADATACVGQTVAVTFSGSAGATFSWTNSNTGIGLPASGTGNINFMTTGPGTANIIVIPMANGCSGTPQSFTITSLSNPTMNNPGNTTTCANASVSIGFSGGAGNTYTWTNSNTAIGLGASGSGNLSFTAANVSSVQTAQISVIPQQGACVGQAQTFNITINPLPVVNISGTLVVCNGDPATLTASGGANYSWNTGQNTASVSVSPTVSTTYTVTVTSNTCVSTGTATVQVNQPTSATVNLLTCDPAQVGSTTNVIQNAAGCDSTITTVTSLDVPGCTPTAALTSGRVSCFGGSDGVLSVTASGGLAPYQFNWSNGTQTGTGQINTSGSSVQILNLTAGNYTVTITAANGLTQTATGQVTTPTQVTAQATAVLAFGQYAVSCDGSMDGTINATAGGGTPGYQFAWSVAGQNGSTLGSVGAGTYDVTVTDANGCSSTASATIVNPPPFDLDITLGDVACGDDYSVATVTPLGGNGPFVVTVDGLVSSAGLNPLISTGEHIVELIDANNCRTDTMIELILPVVPNIVLPDEITITLGEPATIDAVTNLTSWSSIDWSPLPDPNCPQCLHQMWVPDITRDYIVVITDTLGCTASDTIRVVVNNQVDIFVPTIFSPNLDGVNDNWTINTGKSVIALNTLQIYDRWGELLYNWDSPIPVDQWPGWDGTYKGDRMNPGVYVYYFEVKLASGEVVVRKGDLTLVR